MSLKELFEPRDFVLGFDPSDKWEAIERLVAHLVESGRISQESAPALREQVVARERSMSTGMERGIAIPHAAADGLEQVQACMGVSSEGVAFESIDARPAHLVVLLLIPRSQKLLHIRTLADIARILSLESARQALLGAATQQEAWEALARAEAQAV